MIPVTGCIDTINVFKEFDNAFVEHDKVGMNIRKEKAILPTVGTKVEIIRHGGRIRQKDYINN